MILKYFDISWFSSVDGPGTRVVLFLQGCHLRCPWCHSPQSWDTTSPLFFFENRCTLCGACVAACPNNVHSITERVAPTTHDFNKRYSIQKESSQKNKNFTHSGTDGKHFLERSLCERCGACIESCPVSRADRWNSGALGFPGSEMEARDLFRLLEPQLEMLRDIGGLTLSGGEPLLQPGPLLELLSLCAAANIHTALETSLSLPRKHFEPLIGKVDLWLIGLRPTALENTDKKKDRLDDWERVLDNLEFLAARGSNNITVRTPVIPGYTDREECLKKIGDVMAVNNISVIEILPYNPYSIHYYEAAGVPYSLNGTKPVGQTELKRICDYFSGRGFAARIVI